MEAKKHRGPADLDQSTLRAEIARRGLPLWMVAGRLDIGQSTLSGYLTGAIKSPVDLRERLEVALDLEPGTLTPQDNQQI